MACAVAFAGSCSDPLLPCADVENIEFSAQPRWRLDLSTVRKEDVYLIVYSAVPVGLPPLVSVLHVMGNPLSARTTAATLERIMAHTLCLEDLSLTNIHLVR